MSKRKNKHFTLLELLVSMVVLVMIMLFLLNFLNNANDLYHTTMRRNDSFEYARLVFNTVSADLMNMVVQHGSGVIDNNGHFDCEVFDGKPVNWYGNIESDGILAFVTNGRAYSDGIPRLVIYRYMGMEDEQEYRGKLLRWNIKEGAGTGVLANWEDMAYLDVRSLDIVNGNASNNYTSEPKSKTNAANALSDTKLQDYTSDNLSNAELVSENISKLDFKFGKGVFYGNGGYGVYRSKTDGTVELYYANRFFQANDAPDFVRINMTIREVGDGNPEGESITIERKFQKVIYLR